ncbi:SDR family oxidoreductase [Fimbriimonas ginsengisoli]|uniref:SDR family oxidoreductase n=1 Tax=Fimbriimonas ginsengisoli TaxID=1005039 RepID=UPI00046D5655|nr:SDR family oxidoreductase [Fimbriimonas ginsengisoli]
MRDLFRLDGKVAIVTGGAGILGRHFCEGLAAHGADVAVFDIVADPAAELASRLSAEYGVRAIGLACDVSDPESVRQGVDQVVADLGGIHVLHNNAAAKTKDLKAFFAPFEEYSLEVWREIMAVNLDGMMLMAQRVGKQMIEQGKGGSVIQTASIYGVVGPDPRIYEGSEYMGVGINTPAIYAASKAGVIGLSRYLATYWAPHGIRVNTLTPGGNESGQNETFKKNYSARVPLGRMGNPPEMVGAVVYLASDAASYVTGQNIAVDGGWTAW